MQHTLAIRNRNYRLHGYAVSRYFQCIAWELDQETAIDVVRSDPMLSQKFDGDTIIIFCAWEGENGYQRE